MITPASWQPVGVTELEPAALDAVRAAGSALVVAGPGTGKTELLGQRAAFLLQAGGCREPRRILAISFKRDAAANLRERVERRCGGVLARRLDSITFDAFAKQVLDRFWRALPAHLALTGGYGIAPMMTRQGLAALQAAARNGLEEAGHPAHWARQQCGRNPTAAGIEGVTLDAYNKAIQTLCLHPLTIANHAEYLQLVQLRTSLTQAPPTLGFAMIGRMAQAIVIANPSIRAAIRATYSHVFLDEFQDTTSVQFGLIEAIFADSPASLTAVGDDKQRIMVWAGARTDLFAAFEAVFLPRPGAFGRTSLTRNYRSNARIVSILNHIKAKLAPDEPEFIAIRPAPDLPEEKICAVLVAADAAAEADAVAAHVAEAIAGGTDPRAIGLLVRQKASDWEDRIKGQFVARGLLLRNEDRDVGGAAIQDLMTEAYSRTLLDMLDLLTRRHGGPLWTAVTGHVATVDGLDLDEDDGVEQAIADRIDAFHRAERISGTATATADMIRTKIAAIERFFGLEGLRGVAPQYATGDLFERIRTATLAFLVECSAPTCDWKTLFERYRGVGQTPLLTITKSKGLEYDLVMLLGLNDSEWWSFPKDPGEGHSNFFVAASRARNRLMMTRCAYDANAKIREIFDLLDQAGVPHVTMG
jgi:superfamily I DNA/RNA helicase